MKGFILLAVIAVVSVSARPEAAGGYNYSPSQGGGHSGGGHSGGGGGFGGGGGSFGGGHSGGFSSGGGGGFGGGSAGESSIASTSMKYI